MKCIYQDGMWMSDSFSPLQVLLQVQFQVYTSIQLWNRIRFCSTPCPQRDRCFRTLSTSNLEHRCFVVFLFFYSLVVFAFTCSFCSLSLVVLCFFCCSFTFIVVCSCFILVLQFWTGDGSMALHCLFLLCVSSCVFCHHIFLSFLFSLFPLLGSSTSQAQVWPRS